jgi:hypothetical protein
MLSPKTFQCDEAALFVFELTNIGYWYAKPTAISVVVYCNFDPEFRLVELRYGASQSRINNDVKVGVGKMIYFRATGLKLTYGEEGEEVHVKAVTPKSEGEYRIRISAFSDNGVSIKKEFTIKCRNPQRILDHPNSERKPLQWRIRMKQTRTLRKPNLFAKVYRRSLHGK